MPTLLVSSKGQIVLPAALRRRLVRAVPRTDVASLAGMLKARARGVPRRLEDFDPATLTARGRKKAPS
jgi:antitoxin PrlF